MDSRFGQKARGSLRWIGILLTIVSYDFVNRFSCSALDWSFNPSITLSEQYDSNVLMSTNNVLDDFITIFTPKFDLKGEGEDFRLTADGIVAFQKYVNNDDLDTIEYDLRGMANRQWNSRLSTGVDVRFRRDTTLEDQLLEAGIRTLRTERFAYDFGMTQLCQLSERLSVKASESGSYFHYPEGNLPDTEGMQAGLEPAWALSERDRIGLNWEYSYNDYEDTSTIQNLSQLLYWERSLNETTTVQFGAGYRYTWLENVVATYEVVPPGRLVLVKKKLKTTDDGITALGVLKKNWTERLSSTLSLGRDEYSSADARTFERNYIRTALKYDLSELTTLSCDIYYYNNHETGRGDQTTDYVRVSPHVVRKITRDLSIRLAGSYENQMNEYGPTDFPADRYRVWMELTWAFPRWWATH